MLIIMESFILGVFYTFLYFWIGSLLGGLTWRYNLHILWDIPKERLKASDRNLWINTCTFGWPIAILCCLLMMTGIYLGKIFAPVLSLSKKIAGPTYDER